MLDSPRHCLEEHERPVGPAPNGRRRDGDICGDKGACQGADAVAEVVSVEKIGLAAFPDGQEQLSDAVRAGDVEWGRRGPAKVPVAAVEVAPVRRSEIVTWAAWAAEVGREAQDGFAVAPLSCAEEVLPVTANSDSPSLLTPPCAHMPPPRARVEKLATLLGSSSETLTTKP